MFDTFVKKVKIAFTDQTIRNRILYTLAGLLIFRLLAAIPAPGIDPLRLSEFFANNQALGLLNVLSGGGLSGISIVMLGAGPYITASIVMQLMTVMSPRLKSMYHDEGQAGKRRFTQYSRLLTVPFAAIQSFGFLTLLEQQQVITNLGWYQFLVSIVVITAGAVLVMWLGELITEFGVGNGISLIIFAGIVAQLPQAVSQLFVQYTPDQLILYITFFVVAIAVVWAIVMFNEAKRPVPITYSRGGEKGGGGRNVASYLPLKLNQAGVMPIIFGLAIMLFPQMILNFLDLGPVPGGFLGAVQSFYQTQGIWYMVVNFVLVFAFTFFYTSITFEPDSVAENLQKSGGFIPGVRPGESTRAHIAKVMRRITFWGATFLGLIAILPFIMESATGLGTLAIGGTALLIVVSVLVDLLKRLDGQIAMRQY